MARACSGLRVAVGALLAARAGAYPEFWATHAIAEIAALQPGGAFGAMGISNFETGPAASCAISSDVPQDGYAHSAKYTITVSSSEAGGVGHILFPGAGTFDQAAAPSTAVFTDKASRFPSKDWVWQSPASETSVSLYAVCSDGYAGKGYVAEPLTLKAATGPPPPPTPCVDGGSPIRLACRCGAGASAPVCSAGQCCHFASGCAACAPGPTPAPSPLVEKIDAPLTTWVHAGLATLATAGLFPLGAAAALQARGGGLGLNEASAERFRTALVAGWLCLAVAFVCAIFSVQSLGTGHFFAGTNVIHKAWALLLMFCATVQAASALFWPQLIRAPRSRLGKLSILGSCGLVFSGLSGLCTGLFAVGRMPAPHVLKVFPIVMACFLLLPILALVIRHHVRADADKDASSGASAQLRW